MASWLLPVLLTSGITLLTAALGVIWVEIKSSEARQREDMAQFKADVQASEARQRDDMAQFKTENREDMAQLKADNRALNEKLDRLVESLRPARPS